MAPTRVVPFMSVVGPTTGVSEGSLLEAMLELYRELGGDAPNLPDAVASAQRELREGETLAETTWRDIVEGAVARVVLAKAEPEVIATLYGRALPRLTDMRPGGPLALDQFARIYYDATVQGVDALLDNMLGRTLFPGAFRDLGVDARELVVRALTDAEQSARRGGSRLHGS